MQEGLFVIDTTTCCSPFPASAHNSFVVRLVYGEDSCVDQHTNGHSGKMPAEIFKRHPLNDNE